MRKIVFTLLCVLTMALSFPLTARADMGPKPSVVIDFKGLEGTTYYATLLSSVASTGPYSAIDRQEAHALYGKSDGDSEIFLKFAEYRDSDGYYFLQYFEECTRTRRFSWTYHPPQSFKLLLYFPETDRFVVSGERYERYAFDSYFTAELSDTGLSAVRSYDYTNETLSLLARIVLTLLIELVIALPFGFRQKRQLRFIVVVNIVTQVALNLALNLINYHAGPLSFTVFYVILEFVVFLIEAALYTQFLDKYGKKEIGVWAPGVYSLTANAASFALGLWLAHLIPGIF